MLGCEGGRRINYTNGWPCRDIVSGPAVSDCLSTGISSQNSSDDLEPELGGLAVRRLLALVFGRDR